MEDLLRSIFEAFPEKTSIFFEGKCFDCGDAVSIEIIPTSEGFGLLGGALVECSTDKYTPKCTDCYKANGKMIEKAKANSNDSNILNKKNILSLILSTYLWVRK